MSAAFSEVEHAVPDWIQEKWLGNSDQKVNHNVPIKCRSPPKRFLKPLSMNCAEKISFQHLLHDGCFKLHISHES